MRVIQQALSRLGADKRIVDWLGQTPHDYAMKLGKTDILDMLRIEPESDSAVIPPQPQPADESSPTPQERQLALTTADWAMTASNDLHIAVIDDDIADIRKLIAKGADVNAFDEIAQQTVTPLHCAAFFGRLESARILIEHGAELSLANEKEGVGPLHYAAKRGETALHYAAQEGCIDVARRLIKEGADMFASDVDGQTPMACAASNFEIGVVELFIENGVDINAASDRRGKTPLHLTARKPGPTEELIRMGADVNAKDQYGNTPLHLAAKEQIYAVRLFLESGAEVNLQSRDGKTPLYIACVAGKIKIVEMLVEHEADVTIANNRGMTPLKEAVARGNDEIADLLRSKGAVDE